MGALSILPIAAGAIMAWAVEDNSTGFDVRTIEIILLIVGTIGLIASMARGTFIGLHSTRERHVWGDGRTIVENERTSTF